MLEIYDAILIGAIAGLSGAIGILIAVKSMIKTEKIANMILDLTDQLQNSEDLNRFFYIAGGMIANGAKKGIGLPQARGKMGLVDLFLALIGGHAEDATKPALPQTSGFSSNRPPPDIR